MDESDFSWGSILSQTEALGRESDPTTYIKIEPNDPQYKDFTHCGHVMIYCRSKAKSFDMYDRRAVVLMQLRFDGYLGFTGGLVDSGETPYGACEREVNEEMGCAVTVNETHHQFTHFNPERGLVLHFYAVEVSQDVIKRIEHTSVDSQDHGGEVLGLVRVPLYTMADGYLGLPCFLHNNFVGSTRAQLLTTLVKLKVLSLRYVNQVLAAQPKLKPRSKTSDAQVQVT